MRESKLHVRFFLTKLIIFSLVLLCISCSFNVETKNLKQQYFYEYIHFPGEYTKTEFSDNVLINIDFENEMAANYTLQNCSYVSDPLYDHFMNPNRAPNVLKNEHGKVCKLNNTKEASYFFIYVNVPEDSVLTFEYFSLYISEKIVQVFLDDSSTPFNIDNKGKNNIWNTASINIPKGNHRIMISKWYMQELYIDNITLTPDKIEFLEIYPKGYQETYRDGFPIKFTAVAMRGDRSVIPANELNINYSVNGCGNIDNTGLFTPTRTGNCVVTANVYRKNESVKIITKDNVKVHKKNYLSDPVTIGDYTFTGKITNVSGENLDTEKMKFDYGYDLTPMGTNFSADGFFTIKGTTTVPLVVEVLKNGTKYKSNFIIRKPGEFYERIWLRYGPGDYIIHIGEATTLPILDTGDPKYEGDIIGTYYYKYEKYLYVKNTNNSISEEDALWLMPSYVVQSDDFLVSNVANSIIASLPGNATDGDKLKAIHNWVLYNHHYDNVSVNHPEKRKRQDAVSSLKYHLCVCEGYANLYAALVRKIGIPAKVVIEFAQTGKTETLHAWNNVKYNNNWYMVDVTWDDPVLDISDEYNDFGIGNENYTYFMTGTKDALNEFEFGHLKPGVGDNSRSANGNMSDIHFGNLYEGYF